MFPSPEVFGERNDTPDALPPALSDSVRIMVAAMVMVDPNPSFRGAFIQKLHSGHLDDSLLTVFALEADPYELPGSIRMPH